MYAYTVPVDQVGDKQVDIDTENLVGLNRKFFYWRKFNHLHGWMEDLYRKKGGKDEDFNCVTVRLMPEDIQDLRKVVAELLLGNVEALKARKGFFFGGEAMYPEDFESLIRFIFKAEEAFEDNMAVLYNSWW